MKSNLDCVNAVMTNVFMKLKHHISKSPSKILCVNGCGPYSVFEVYSIAGDANRIYPQVPNIPENHCLLRLNEFVYTIAGDDEREITNKVYQLNLTLANMQWREVASMKFSRSCFGAAVFCEVWWLLVRPTAPQNFTIQE